MDHLIEMTNRAMGWPPGSRSRDVQRPVIARKAENRRREIAESEDLLNRQWVWLEANELEQDTERYGQKISIFTSTLSDYEDLVDGLRVAEEFLKS